ncbi:MAG: GWxTD domain-containing protein [Gemmatimonadota bacterium]
MKLLTTGVLALLLSSGIPATGGFSSAVAQEGDGTGGLRIRLARFWRGSGQTLVEGVIGLPVRVVDGQANTALVELLVRDSTGQVLHREAWTDTISDRIASFARARGGTELTRPVNFAVRSGRYQVTVAVTRAGQRDTAHLSIRGFAAAPLVSDILVSNRIRALAEGESAGPSEAKKGRFAIESGTRITIFPTEPKLWYYLELYPVGSAPATEQLEFAISRSSGGQPLFKTQRPMTVSEKGGVDAAGLPVAGLPPGDYVLTLTARVNDRTERRDGAFTMGTLQESPVPSATGSETDLLERYFSTAVRDDSAVSRLVEALTLASPGESVPSGTTQLPVDAKRRFLARFWAKIPDPQPVTPNHEMVEEYSQRVDFVAREYRERDIGRSGARTDRGRIYLRYGPPDAKQIMPVTGSKAVEVWKYTRNRGLKFAFMDETGFSGYNLIYTTDPNERSLADWTDRVRDVETIRAILSF